MDEQLAYDFGELIRWAADHQIRSDVDFDPTPPTRLLGQSRHQLG